MPRVSWLDEEGQSPQIDSLARQLSTFLETIADGRVDQHELDAQERRVVELMREIEPQLDDALHERVTALLCELTAYDIMQMMHGLSTARARQFKG